MKHNATELEERLMQSSGAAAACREEAVCVPVEGVGEQQQQQQQQQQQRLLQLQQLHEQQHQQQQQQMLLHRSSNVGERFFLRGLMFVKIGFGALVLFLLLLAALHIDATASVLRQVIAGVQDLGGFAPIAYIALYVLCIACFLPAEFMVVIECGEAPVLMGTWLPVLSSPEFMEKAGLAISRLTSYLFGVTALKASHLLLGTFSGTPLILAFNFIGSALSDLKDLDIRNFSWTWQRLSLVALGVMMAGISVVYIGVLTRRKLEAAYAAAVRERSQGGQLLLSSSSSSSGSSSSAAGLP
ncbi:hypothetical protein, conserved [Eimeria acervulina]|uniref:SNARE associated Golgi protein n=1 Tax=Eimeria acervulina TaxID=5801 RepID=U6G937_EIMAC|nr:hypothetical protein, conserved [Eimeria acervulina]CDI76776.1 hypothetical protein, conserved [Eimeria acervulina]